MTVEAPSRKVYCSDGGGAGVSHEVVQLIRRNGLIRGQRMADEDMEV